MSPVVAWTFLVLVVLALVAASVLRRQKSVVARDRRALPRPGPMPAGTRPGVGREGDSLGALGLSPVRPAPPRSEARPAATREPVRVPETASADKPTRDEDDLAPSWTFDDAHEPAPVGVLSEPTGQGTERLASTSSVPGSSRPVEPTPAAPVPDGSASPYAARPAAAREPVADAPAAGDSAEAPAAPPAPSLAPAPSPHAAPLSSARPAPAAVRPDSPLWDPPGPAEHLLASLAACTGGTVAVLRHDGARYHVDALAGLTAETWPAPLDADGDLHPLDRAPLDRLLSVLDGDDLDALTYLVPGTARTALVRALDETETPRVLVAATLAVEADRVDLATARLVGDYVDLLATLRADTATRPEAADLDDVLRDWDDGDREDGALDAPPEPDDDGDADDRPAGERRGPEPLPRSVILTGEINAARDARRPLAFALVTLADADALLDGPDEATDVAEADLAARLSAAPRVRRVEPFGPLLYGVFLDATPDQVSPWARALSGGGPALHVGAVAPAGGAPEAVREAATEALEEAYAQNVVCVVLD